MAKVLASINEKYPKTIFTEKIDVSQRRDLSYEFNVRYVPHLLFVNAEGDVFKQEVGFMQEEDVILAFEKVGIIIKQ